MSKNNNNSGGVGFLGLLLLLFLGLKLGNIINWSWWWVFSPLWGPLAVLLLLYLIALIYEMFYK